MIFLYFIKTCFEDSVNIYFTKQGLVKNSQETKKKKQKKTSHLKESLRGFFYE